MAIVVGTAGHIDHGKTTLLRALTGIDADRLPEEQRRGMTIDVGYAHLDLPDGGAIDFVDVPGHDRLIGNMLVGAGEIDAALLVVAADDGPRPQTLEHLELLDALDIADGVVAVTKADLVAPDVLAAAVTATRDLIAPSRLAAAPVVAVSAPAGHGLAELRDHLVALADRLSGRTDGMLAGSPRLALDRVFSVRGRGVVVTGTLRDGSVSRGDTLRVVPSGREVRIREVQVRGRRVERAGPGRVALNLAGAELSELRRGDVVAASGAVTATRRLLVSLEPATDLAAAGHRPIPTHGERLRLHLGTEQADAMIVRDARTAADLGDGASTALLRLDRAVAAALGDRLVLRRPSPGTTAAGGRILDPTPSLGVSRRRATPAALAALATAVGSGDDARRAAALVGLHGAATVARLAPPGAGPIPGVRRLGPLLVADAVVAAVTAEAVDAVRAQAIADPLAGGSPLAGLRPLVARALRRRATIAPEAAAAAASALIDDLVASGTLAAGGDRVRLPDQAASLPDFVLTAMARLEAALSVATPPPLTEAARLAGCPPAGMRALLAEDRIVRLEPEIAYARSTYARLAALALRMAAAGPLSPAAFRDATGTSRKYALAILEDLDRRGLLQRTVAGHVPGPRAPRGTADPS